MKYNETDKFGSQTFLIKDKKNIAIDFSLKKNNTANYKRSFQGSLKLC